MAVNGKVIITCAVTGAIHTPTMSPYLPITPDEIAAEAIAAAEAGAAILHLHARDPETGKPDQTPEAFARFLPRIKQAHQRRDQHHHRRQPLHERRGARPAGGDSSSRRSPRSTWGRSTSASIHLARQIQEFKFDWERQHLEATRDLVFRNTFKDIEYILETCYDNGTRFEFECYDIAPPLQPQRISPTAGWSSRRSSSSRCSACSAASARTPRTSCT